MQYLPFQTSAHTTFYHWGGLTWNWTFNGSIYYVEYLHILRFYFVVVVIDVLMKHAFKVTRCVVWPWHDQKTLLPRETGLSTEQMELKFLKKCAKCFNAFFHLVHTKSISRLLSLSNNIKVIKARTIVIVVTHSALPKTMYRMDMSWALRPTMSLLSLPGKNMC